MTHNHSKRQADRWGGRVLAGALLSMALATSAQAAEEQRNVVSWSPASWQSAMREMPTGDAQRGKGLHDQRFCASCHGEHGESLTGNWPHLAGQRAEYTYKQLLDYADHRRREDSRAHIMNEVSEQLSEQEMADLAVFYEQQGLPDKAKPDSSHPAHELVSVGDPSRLITPCAACHGNNGSGGINESPSLRGQPHDYFVRTMKMFRDGARHNDVAKGMAQFAEPLTDEEIAALADYYAVD
ncbi:c-type cytochrome [Guyparkeria sp.]|uniref:c-type cytochrome n=1 Tax=Guyparkeria sp. TaxID=2035736 RepID=UPI003970B9E4